jgi:hypothetical protein
MQERHTNGNARVAYNRNARVAYNRNARAAYNRNARVHTRGMQVYTRVYTIGI